MRSVQPAGDERILLAAIDLFGRQGFDGTSVRQVASTAGVSAALVMHHFGSKASLREACDDHVLAFLRSEKSRVLLGTVDFDSVRGYLADHPEVVPISRYLDQALTRRDAASRTLFNRMIDDGAANLRLGEEQGVVRASDDPEARAAVLTAWSASMRLFGDQVAERLGGSSLLDAAVAERVKDVTLDLYENGLLTDDRLRVAMQAGSTVRTAATADEAEVR
jgi:AcrR family transcriptional regulator